FPSLPVLTDTLPSGVTFVSATGGVTPTNGTLTFNLPALPVGATSTVSITVQAPSFPGPLNNSASVTSVVDDPNTANNTASASTDVPSPTPTATATATTTPTATATATATPTTTATATATGTATSTPGPTATSTPQPATPGTTYAGNLKFITPVRIVDTRSTDGGPIGFNPDGTPIAAGKLQANQSRRVKVNGRTFNLGLGAGAGTFTFPNDVTMLLLNVTIVQNGGSGGFVTVYPGDVSSPPNASTVNPSTGLDVNFWATGV